MNSNINQKQKRSAQQGSAQNKNSSIGDSYNDLINSTSSLNVFESDWKPGQVTLLNFTTMRLSNSNDENITDNLSTPPSGDMSCGMLCHTVNEPSVCVKQSDPDHMSTHGTFLGHPSSNELISPFPSRASSTFKTDSVPALMHYRKLITDETLNTSVTNHLDETVSVNQISDTSATCVTSSSGSHATNEHLATIAPRSDVLHQEPVVYTLTQSDFNHTESRGESMTPVITPISQVFPTHASPVIYEPSGRIGLSICEPAGRISTRPSTTINTETSRLSEGGKAEVLEKPVVADTRIFRRENVHWRPYSRIHPNSGCNLSRKDSWSSPDLDKLGGGGQASSENSKFVNKYRNRQSSFATGRASGQKYSHKSVHLDLDVYHTLLDQGVNENDVNLDQPEDESSSSTHALSSVQDGGDETLSARVELITQKFDSFRRGQLRAISFRYDPSINDECTERRRHSSSCDAFEGKDEQTSPHSDSVFKNCKINSSHVDRTVLTPGNIARIELFFNSQQTQVFSCRCLAELFLHNINTHGLSSPITSNNDNVIKNEAYVNTGVPVLVLNAGTTITRPRELFLVLAQQDTGFVLWQDKVNYMSEYKEVQPGVHTMRVSGSTSKSMHLHIFDKVAAAEFLVTFRMMTSDPRDELWKMSSKGEAGKLQDDERRWSGSRVKLSKQEKKLEPLKHATEKKLGGGSKSRWGVTTQSRLCKADISRPCDLQLITRVDPTDEHFRFAFADLLPVTILGGDASEGKQQDATVSSED